MSYFMEQYPNLRYPIASNGHPGLRSPQLGAIHSIAAHFTLHPDLPALVAMPTGSGKTAVLMMTPFVLQARRVLVVTPSALVRRQVAHQFESLSLLRQVGALPADLALPKVRQQEHQLSQPGDWPGLEVFDVVAGTPQCVSPGRKGVAKAPSDLFDLLLIDEAHHSPAPTWDAVLRSFPEAKRVLFTATPFREDRQAIEGRFAYNYPMREAYRQGLYSVINYLPVSAEGADADEALALAAEDQLARDREEGFEHRVLARTDSRTKADRLAQVYNQTSLKMGVIHGDLGDRTVKQRIDALVQGDIDGLICVGMLGEGFDLPALKIAAIHDPHRSLVPTLQFIGRFSRVGEHLGPATFLAVPTAELEIQKRKMYESGAVWREIVHELGDSAAGIAEKLRDLAINFHTGARVEVEYRDLPIEGFVPQHHVKVYRLPESAGIHLDHKVVVPPPLEIAFRSNSEELHAVLLMLREIRSPRWTTLPQLADVVHDLVLVYHDRDASLLFIHSSRTSTQLYEKVARSFTGGAHKRLSMSRINRVLAEMVDFEFFNIGMRRRAQHSYDESYRIIAGANAQNVISPTDGRWYYRGHVFGAAHQATDDARISIGYSSSSKVWSNRSTTIDGFVQWCKELAGRISRYDAVATGSPIDQLQFGVELSTLPQGVLFAEWNEYAYTHPRRVRGPHGELQLLDFDLEVVREESRDGIVRLRLTVEDLAGIPPRPSLVQLSLDYWLEDGDPQVQGVTGPYDDYIVVGREEAKLVEWLMEFPPRLFLSGFAVIDGMELYDVGTAFSPFNFDLFYHSVDWSAEGVNPQFEFYEGKEVGASVPRSVHDYLWWKLPQDKANEVVFYDHGPGEMADFITLGRVGSELWITFYHCKGAGGVAGARVGDAYEVAGQAAKSLAWLRAPSRLHSRMERRLHRKTGASRFHPDKGDLAFAGRLIEEGRRGRMRFQIVAVQPGFSSVELKKETYVTDVLAAASEYIVQHQCEPLRVWGANGVAVPAPTP